MHKDNEIRKLRIPWHFVFELWLILAWEKKMKMEGGGGSSDGDGGGSNSSSNSNKKLRNVRGE